VGDSVFGDRTKPRSRALSHPIGADLQSDTGSDDGEERDRARRTTGGVCLLHVTIRVRRALEGQLHLFRSGMWEILNRKGNTKSQTIGSPDAVRVWVIDLLTCKQADPIGSQPPSLARKTVNCELARLKCHGVLETGNKHYAKSQKQRGRAAIRNRCRAPEYKRDFILDKLNAVSPRHFVE
jgi:hypothetical protein